MCSVRSPERRRAEFRKDGLKGAFMEIVAEEYTDCFQAFIRAMRNDYICCAETRDSVKSQPYLTAFSKKVLNGEGYEIQFVEQMSLYLMRFKNPAVEFGIDYERMEHYKPYNWGATFRRYGDTLYVATATPESKLQVGDKVVAASVYGDAGFAKVSTMEKRYETNLYGDTAEREMWDPVLHFMNRYLVEDPDSEKGTRRVTTEFLDIVPDPAFEIAELADDAVLLTLRDLSDAAALVEFLDSNRPALEQAKTLIIDVRTCQGGAEEAALPLLAYVISAPTALSDFMEDRCLTNYSKNNCNRQAAVFNYLAQQQMAPFEAEPEAAEPEAAEADEVAGAATAASSEGADDAPTLGAEAEAPAVPEPDPAALAEAQARKAMFEQWRDDILSRSGQGIVEEECPISEELKASVDPAGQAQHVYLLTDVTTRDAADLLAEVCKGSDRATIVGRPTMGSRGYFNPAVVVSSRFSLAYPTSRYTDEGLARHYAQVGVPVDIHVEWTPEFLERDLDLEAAKEAAGL